MSATPAPTPEAATRIGDERALRLLTQLVAIAPTNLEDPIHGRYEKPNYLRAADAIVRAARDFGLATRIYDPTVVGDVVADWHGQARPNVIVDLDAGADDTVLVLAHYDVVPVPAEQLTRWRSPPHTLTYRSDHRLYGRGSNDDLGSGVVGGLLAMARLAEIDRLPRNVRLIAACDEETGGEGGVEAIKEHDAKLRPGEAGRILAGEVAPIPDGSTETTVGSSGVAFLQASFSEPVPLSATLAYGEALVGLHEVAKTWRSVYASPDWPDRHAPEPVLTGRATVTQFDLADGSATPGVTLCAAHAETDAANQIPNAVTLVLAGPAAERTGLAERLAPLVPAPFRVASGGATSLHPGPDTTVVQVIGEAAHGGYPHRGHNPVPVALALLRAAADRGWVDAHSLGTATYTVDLRLIPEMELDAGLAAALGYVRAWSASRSPKALVVAPPSRCRSGYALAPDHPQALKLARILGDTLGSRAVRGEYGGTDASSLRGLMTPKGEPLPAIVFGSMDPPSRIHDAEESADPVLLKGVCETIRRFVSYP
jgi:acetylornithine deacetylase/succinyl-diaminopimelate desuccinylase-like protein